MNDPLRPRAAWLRKIPWWLWLMVLPAVPLEWWRRSVCRHALRVRCLDLRPHVDDAAAVRAAVAAAVRDAVEHLEALRASASPRDAYLTATQVILRTPSIRGVFFWTWLGPGGPHDRHYTVRGKPAETVLRHFFMDAGRADEWPAQSEA